MMHAHALEISIKLRTKLFKLTCLLTPAVVYTHLVGTFQSWRSKYGQILDAFVYR